MNNPLFWQSLTFSTVAVLFVVVSTWWLYRSPMKSRPAGGMPPSPRLAGWLAGLLGLSAAQLVTGALWDASMHLQTGEIPAGADFLWPPHLMIYASFLLSLLVALGATAGIALPAWRQGERDPRAWFRRNPYLGAVALASLYSLLSIPGDALWHELYGIDLTAWSPPHVMLGLTSCTVVISALGVLARARPAMRRPGWGDVGTLVLLGLMLNVAYIIGVLEWELPGGRSPLVDARPIWLYPLVGGSLALFSLALARRLARFRWAATGTALAFYALRLGISFGLGTTGNIAPHVPLWFILGAMLLDAAAARRLAPGTWQTPALAALFTAGYYLLAVPALISRHDLQAFTQADFIIGAAATLVLGLLLLPLAERVGARLAGSPASAA